MVLTSLVLTLLATGELAYNWNTGQQTQVALEPYEDTLHEFVPTARINAAGTHRIGSGRIYLVWAFEGDCFVRQRLADDWTLAAETVSSLVLIGLETAYIRFEHDGGVLTGQYGVSGGLPVPVLETVFVSDSQIQIRAK